MSVVEGETAEEVFGKRPTPFVAVASIIISMGLVAISSGIMFGYIPIKLAAENFPPWISGAMVTGVAAGGVIGCLGTGFVVRRAGHARAFMALVALQLLSFVAISAGTFPWIWLAARFVFGFAVTGLFIVSQSWLNDATDNEWRGRVIALFYMIYILSVGFGSFLLRFTTLEGPLVPMLALVAVTLSIFPIAMTRLPPPPPPESAAIAFRAIWQISPVGPAGMLTVGGLTLLVAGFAPIFAATQGYQKNDIALMMFLMQFGMIAIQFPLGAWSDRIDRRIVLLVASALVVIATGILFSLPAPDFMILVVVFALWSGATESIYAISNAHANDRSDPQYYVSLSSTLLIAWSLSGFIVPAITTAITPIFGPRSFMMVALILSGSYLLFVLGRLRATVAVPDEDTEAFVPMSAQIPYGTDLAAGDADPEIEQQTPDADRLAELNEQAEVLLGMMSWPTDRPAEDET